MVKLRGKAVLVLAGALLCLAQAGSLRAQDRAASGVFLGGGAAAGLLVGETQDFLDGGWGPSATLTWRSEDFPIEGLLDVTWLRLEEDVEPGSRATNSIVHGLAGPALSHAWGPVRPWLGFLAGSATSVWETRVGIEEREGHRSSFAWGGVLGVELTLTGGDHPLSLGGSGRLLSLGELDFGRVPAPNQELGTAAVVSEEVRLVELRVGLRVGL